MAELVPPAQPVQAVEPFERLRRAEVADGTRNEDMLRIVLFGKTGCGKSSTGNTILGRAGFEELFGQRSGTAHCRQEFVNINGKNIKIIDTPGVCDVFRDPKEVLFEVSRCLCFASPGPHALLFVINADARFTQEEYEAYNILRNLFERHLIKYIILVFTHCEQINNDKEKLKKMHAQYGQMVDDAKTNGRNLPDLRNIVKDASDRIVLMSNKADKDTKDRQVLDLLDQITNVSKNANYVDHFRDARTEQTAKLLEIRLDEIKKKNPGMSQAAAWTELQRQIEAQKAWFSNEKAVVTAVYTGVWGATLVSGTAVTGGAAAVVVGAFAAGGALYSKAEDGKCSIL